MSCDCICCNAVTVDKRCYSATKPFVCTVLLQSHKELCEGVVALAQEVQSDQLLTNLIRRKFAIKCTTGEISLGY